MKIALDRDALLKPLQMVVGVVERRQTMPILANVLIQVTHDNLTIMATDLEVELSSTTALVSPPEKPGSVTVSGRKILDICRALPPQSILELESKDTRLNVRSKNSTFHLITLPVEEFPHFQEQPESARITIPQNIFLSLVKRTYFAIADDHPHYYLNGLLLNIQNKTIYAMASDAHRMSLYTISDSSIEDIALRVIVPKKCIAELQRLLADNDTLIDLIIAKNHIIVKGSNFTIVSKLIDSKYPNYTIPTSQTDDKKILLDRDEFKEALVRVGVVSNEILRSMRFELDKNVLRMTSNNKDQEQAEEQITIDYNGAYLEMGFNITYLLDVLATIKTQKITMTFQDNNGGAVIEEVDGVENCVYIVMPFQL